VWCRDNRTSNSPGLRPGAPVIRLARLLAELNQPGNDKARAVAGFLRDAPDPAAHRLLTDPPRRMISLAVYRTWVEDDTGLPPWLIDAARSATGDLAEALALCLPPPPPLARLPDLAQVLASLASLPPGPLARAELLALSAAMPPPERAALIRLVTGTLRLAVDPDTLLRAHRLAAGQALPAQILHSILAVMIYAEATVPPGAGGPELTLALASGNGLVPIARARTALPAAETQSLLAWVRAASTGRFGPLHRVPATQLVTLAFEAVMPNRRRASGIALTRPQVVAWHPDRAVSDAAPLAALTGLLPNAP